MDYIHITTAELEILIAKHKASFKAFNAPPVQLKAQAKTISDIRTILDSRIGEADENDDTEEDISSS